MLLPGTRQTAFSMTGRSDHVALTFRGPDEKVRPAGSLFELIAALLRGF